MRTPLSIASTSLLALVLIATGLGAQVKLEGRVVTRGKVADPTISNSDRAAFLTSTIGDSLTHQDAAAIGAVKSSRVLVLRFFSAAGIAMTIGNVSGLKVTVSVGDKQLFNSQSGSSLLSARDQKYLEISLENEELTKARKNTLVTIEATITGEPNPLILYGRAWDIGEGYGVMGGLWFPAGPIFSVTLDKQAGDGVLSAMPISAGYGRRFFRSSGAYTGYSLVGSATVSSKEDKKIVNNGFIGLLIDIDGALYTGVSYIFNTGGPNPGPAIIIGAGPKLLKYLTDFHK